MQKMTAGILIMTLTAMTLTACAGQSRENATESQGIVTETAVESEAVTGTETIAETEAYDREGSLAAYRQALEELYNNCILPNGNSIVLMGGDVSENKFSVYDVDNDGREELILEYLSGSMADITAFIYDYDEEADALREELVQFPALTFYDNAVIEANISHNQGYAGEFWPYTFYTYDKESDTYKSVCFADAWDRVLSEVNYDGTTFPEEADKDGDGIVYYLRSSYEDNDAEPIDGAAYEQWHRENVGNVVEIPYMDLTEENIRNIQ